EEGPHRAVTDYISGMTDDYAVRTYEQIFIPQKWSL
ncbi:MAG: deoxyguanosinetriphosphate triphosphohydrolase, partial [Oscillospiraceae bacterium]